jgi:phosphoribosylformylglycinamidine cyclo-ligase
MAHITGGGIPGNLNRALPDSVDAVVHTSSWTVPNLFIVLQRAGAVSRDEMFRAFNMGVGLVAVCAASEADGALAKLRDAGEAAWILGEIVPSS